MNYKWIEKYIYLNFRANIGNFPINILILRLISSNNNTWEVFWIILEPIGPDIETGSPVENEGKTFIDCLCLQVFSPAQGLFWHMLAGPPLNNQCPHSQ